MKVMGFSRKQMKLLTWWCASSPLCHHSAIICDGAVRSGKTFCMSISFILWAFVSFNGMSFALCGKTITSLRRNVITPLLPFLRGVGFQCEDKTSKNVIEISFQGKTNRFYLFGGKDEGSAALIQGITLAGVLLDEVALMPRSFVEQSIARCSVEGSRFWFNCNPEHPYHWFYLEWIQKAAQKNALHLHFTMEDNPSLSPEIINRYQTLYSGRFFDRFVLGKWVQAQGLVYPDFSEEIHLFDEPPQNPEKFYISCDYGTVNPTSMGLWGLKDGVWHRISEYYYDSKREKAMRTDEEHYRELCRLAGCRDIHTVIVDPSAASFMECIRRHGKFSVIPAKNEVIDGIRRVSSALKEGRLKFSRDCTDTIREFALYSWDENAAGDRPIKENDHAMDEIRYFVNNVLDEPGDFFVASVLRSEE